jgi:hypothetical protein
MEKKLIHTALAVVLAVAVIVYVYRKGRSDNGLPKYAHHRARSRFTSDIDNWPTNGEFGAQADTYPYGNYASGVGMTYPWYNPP